MKPPLDTPTSLPLKPGMQGRLANRAQGFGGSADDALRDYCLALIGPENLALENARKRQELAGVRPMQLSLADVQHLSTIVAALDPRNIVEFGTLCGYSGIAMLNAARSDATLHTFEIDPRHAELARESFSEAGFADRVTLYVGDAPKELSSLPAIEFDLCFIDGGFKNYPAYLDWAEINLRVGGILVADNAFHFGKVINPESTTASASIPTVKCLSGSPLPGNRSTGSSPADISTAAIREFNHRVFSNSRFQSTILPTEEGMLVAVKKR